jgi:hypothetical protein
MIDPKIILNINQFAAIDQESYGYTAKQAFFQIFSFRIKIFLRY